jgi:hypothetical protein
MATADHDEQLRLEALVGNPRDKMFALIQRIQDQNVKSFSAVEAQFLDALWTLDTFRTFDVIPLGPKAREARGVDAKGVGAYRSKGNFFSEVMTSILSNKTTSALAPRGKVQGFSQKHQIDVAWPSRTIGSGIIDDPLICCEAKLTGAPGVNGGKPRGGYEDFSNRRKEMKFQSTDLKLYRNRANTTIFDWDQWRKRASPLVYTLWAARLDRGSEQRKGEQFGKMVSEAHILTSTYSDGVGVFGFVENDESTGYISASSATETAERVASLDKVLSTIAAEIQTIMHDNNNQVPAPRAPIVVPASGIDDTSDDD